MSMKDTYLRLYLWKNENKMVIIIREMDNKIVVIIREMANKIVIRKIVQDVIIARRMDILKGIAPN